MPLDPKVVRQIREVGGQPLLRELYQTFLDLAPQRLEQLRAGLESGDLGAAERTAHSIRSSAASLGARELAASAGELEAEIHDGSDGLLESRYPAFELLFAELVGHLRLELDRGDR